jgi:hypothetical protein
MQRVLSVLAIYRISKNKGSIVIKIKKDNETGGGGEIELAPNVRYKV